MVESGVARTVCLRGCCRGDPSSLAWVVAVSSAPRQKGGFGEFGKQFFLCSSFHNNNTFTAWDVWVLANLLMVLGRYIEIMVSIF